MKSFYSLIRYVNNPLSKENIAIGLIVISGNKVFYNFSNNKINFVSKINPENYKLFEYTLDKINSFIKKELEYGNLLFSNDLDMNQNYLNRLSIYNNGFIQFDKPVAINIDFDDVTFKNFFDKYIDLNIQRTERKNIDRRFKNIIYKVFSEPLKDLIDIDVKIKKEQIPGLFFDYKLDGIGKNDKLYSVKSIDLNSEKSIDIIQKEISEFETLNDRIDRFTQSDLFTNENRIESKKTNEHYLIIDEYKGNKNQYQKLYEIITKENNFPYTVIGTSDLVSITSEIINSGAGKFIGTL
jgi:hypothetical protein